MKNYLVSAFLLLSSAASFQGKVFAAELTVALQEATATFSQDGGYTSSRAIDGVASGSFGWAIQPDIQAQTAVFETVENIGFEVGTKLSFTLSFQHQSPSGGTHALGMFRISVTTDPRSEFADGLQVGGDLTANWTVLSPISATSDQGATLTVLQDGAVLASGASPITDTYQLAAQTTLTGITGIRVEALEHASLPHGGPGRAEANGNFVLSEFRAAISEINPNLVLTAPLQHKTALVGEDITLTVGAEAPGALSYAWTFNGVSIQGETGDTLFLNDVQSAQSGEYAVVVTSGDQTVSSEATLHVGVLNLPVGFQNATATFSQYGLEVGLSVDENLSDGRGWAILPSIQDQIAVFETIENLGFQGGTVLSLSLASLHESPVGGSHTLGRFRLAVTTDSRDEFADGVDTGGDVTANWILLEPIGANSDRGTTLTILEDGSILASGETPVTDTYTVIAKTELTGITGVRLEVMEDPSLPQGGPGRSEANGNFVLSEFSSSAMPAPATGELVIVGPLENQTAGYGGSALFRVTAQGPGTFTYSWAFNGQAIQGASGDTLIVEDLNWEDSGEYTVVVNNGTSTVNSTASLSVEAVIASVPLQNPTATFSQELGGFLISRAVDGVADGNSGWAIQPEIEEQIAVFETVQDAGFAGGTILTFNLASLHASSVGGSHTLGKFRLSATTDPRNEFADGAQTSGDVTANWITLDPLIAFSEAGATLEILEDGSVLASGLDPVTDTYTITLATSLTGITGFRIEVLEDPSLPHNGPGRQAGNGNFVLSEFEVKMVTANTPPTIIQQPQPASVRIGDTISFEVVTASSTLVAYQWFKDGTPLTGETGNQLILTEVRLQEGGVYTVRTSNSVGASLSDPAALVVRPPDLESPVVSITSPAAGTNETDQVTLTGTALDNEMVVALQFELNGESPILLSLQNEEFFLGGLRLNPGENVLRVQATDEVGNIGSDTVTIYYQPARMLYIPEIDPVQEGATIIVPVELSSIGGVGGMTFQVLYPRHLVADPVVEWVVGGAGVLTDWHQFAPGRARGTFVLPGEDLAPGVKRVMNLAFQTRSIAQPVLATFQMQVIGAYSATGEPYLSGTESRSRAVQITKRVFPGDNNGNRRLDVGDASVMLRFVTGFEPARTWDIAGNDINENAQIDAGDAIRVLRVAADLDPQPAGANAADLMAELFGGYTGGAAVTISPDDSVIYPNSKVKIAVRLTGWTGSLNGASFKVDYPADVLRLEDGSSHQTGGIVPANALAVWNVSPGQMDYDIQNGSVSVAMGSSEDWDENEGVLAEFIFTVQPDLDAGEVYPVRINNIELSGKGGFQMSTLSSEVCVLRAGGSASGSLGGQMTENGFELTFDGIQAGASYRIEVSENLVNWTELSTGQSQTGTIQIMDPEAAGKSHRFYRATQIE